MTGLVVDKNAADTDRPGDKVVSYLGVAGGVSLININNACNMNALKNLSLNY